MAIARELAKHNSGRCQMEIGFAGETQTTETKATIARTPSLVVRKYDLMKEPLTEMIVLY